MSTYRVRITETKPLVYREGQFLVVDRDGQPAFTDDIADATVFTNYGEAEDWTETVPGEVEEFQEFDAGDLLPDKE